MAKEIKSEIMNESDIKRAITRMAHEILEKNRGGDDLVLLGIRTRGIFFAERLAEVIKQVEGITVPVGTLDITLYRDDIAAKGGIPIVGESHVNFDLNGKKVVIIGDRDGIPGQAIQACAETAGAEVVFSSTECFV